MARKGREPLTEAPPPAASSSSDEDSSDEEVENQSSSGEEEEQQNSPLTPPPPPPSSTKKPPTQKKSDPPKPTESDSDSESDTESDSPPTKVEPIPSKAMKSEPDPKKPRSSSKPTKRPSGPSDIDKGSTKKPKKEKTEPSGPPQAQKQLFQRLWSEDDEIVILKGMIEYKAKKGYDPMSDADDFLEFIKKSLHVVDVKKDQMVNKIRRLKKKYQNAKSKKISNPHELHAFVLSSKIWGSSDDGGVTTNNGVIENDNSSLKACSVKSKASNSNSKGGKGVNGLAFEDGRKSDDGKKKDEGEEGEEAGNWVIGSYENVIQLGDVGKIGGVDERVMKEGLKLLGEEERGELEEKWRKHNVAEMEMLLRRLELYRETTRRILDALKSSKH